MAREPGYALQVLISLRRSEGQRLLATSGRVPARVTAHTCEERGRSPSCVRSPESKSAVILSPQYSLRAPECTRHVFPALSKQTGTGAPDELSLESSPYKHD